MSTFRVSSGEEATQAPTPEAKTPDLPAGNDAKLGVYAWEQTYKQPYATKIWEATESWDILDQTTRADAELISEHFRNSKEYRQDAVGYRDYLKKLEGQTDTKSAPIQVRIKKISEFIRYLQRTA